MEDVRTEAERNRRKKRWPARVKKKTSASSRAATRAAGASYYSDTGYLLIGTGRGCSIADAIYIYMLFSYCMHAEVASGLCTHHAPYRSHIVDWHGRRAVARCVVVWAVRGMWYVRGIVHCLNCLAAA